MFLRTFKILSLIAILFLLSQSFSSFHATASDYAQAASTTPRTIPSLKQWRAGTGSYTFSQSSRIVLDPIYVKPLSTTAIVFRNDLRSLTGRLIPVVIGNSKSGDIYFSLNAHDQNLGSEEYILSITDRLLISAQTDAGAFYATRTILQLLKQGHTIPGGTAHDWPDYTERNLMVDVGRKYFSIQWLSNQIKELAYLKMNYLHLHFSDNLGFRLESSSHSEIVTSPYYTKTQIRNLVTLAQQYHITIIPEIDFPAHDDALLASHPELQLKSTDGTTNAGDIDLGKEASYKLIKDLLQEYLPLFPGPYWHAGADEYLDPGQYSHYPQLQAYAQAHYGSQATGIDAYLGYIKWIDGIVRSHGKTLRIWDDAHSALAQTGTVVGLNSNIILELWDGNTNPQTAINEGHFILNATLHPTYYVLGRYTPDPANLYEKWAPNIQWSGGQDGSSVTPRNPKLLGGQLHIWCDQPDAQTEDEVASGILNPLRAIAQNLWGAPKLVPTYQEFTTIINSLGHAPGYIAPSSSTPTVPPVPTQR